MSKIEWTDATWNPITGCSAVSDGCMNCYAAAMTKRLESMGVPGYLGLHNGKHFNGKIRLLDDRLDIPKRWRKPRRVFVNSMSDLFHENVSDEFIGRVFRVMVDCPQHTFQVLTKRASRMGSWWMENGYDTPYQRAMNIWTGVSVEDQRTARDRIVELQYVPRNAFVSMEPMLGPITLSDSYMAQIDWLIVGCESGPKRRPCNFEWVREIVEQCVTANVPVFVKQLSMNRRVSHDLSEWPEDLRRREFPAGMTFNAMVEK